MKIALIDCGSKRISRLKRIVAGSGAAVSPLLLEQANMHDFKIYDAVIISGGPHLFTGKNGRGLIERFMFIDRLTQPTLGICLGHQAIGIRHGAGVFRGKARRESDVISRRRRHPLLEGLDDEFTMKEDHCEGIECPQSFTVLAGSTYYGNEIMVNDDKQLYGIQAHPEISGLSGETILNNFLVLLKTT